MTTAAPARQAPGPGSELPAGQIAPSILSADFSRLGDELTTVLEAGARVVHVDVMDGRFVPAITMGPLVVDAIRDQVHAAGALLDVHLMVERPENQVEAFADAGADLITVHTEATAHVHRVLAMIRERGCRAGLALNPATPIEHALAAAEGLDLVLCMTVNPGWPGQAFIPGSIARIAELRRRLPGPVTIEVDGGIGETTAAGCREAGAAILVAGSAIFGAEDPAAAFGRLAARIEAEVTVGGGR